MTVSWLPTARAGTRTAFVLGGGGNLGAVQVGMLRAVLQRGIVPDLVVGCSVGAINGAAVAADPSPSGVDAMIDMWAGLDGDSMFPAGRLSAVRLLTRRAAGMVANDGLRGVLEHGLGIRRFEETEVPLQVVATSLETGRERWFSSGPLVEPILASAALPAVFPPVKIDGEWLIDGGVVDNVPLDRALALGATTVYVFHVGNFEKPRPHPKKPLDVLLQSFSIARNHRWLVDRDSVPDGVEVVVLPAFDPGNLRYNDFRRSRELIERGAAVTAAYLDELPSEAMA